MANPFFMTIILIALVTLIGAFIKGRSKDRCLVDFKDLNVTAEFKDGKFIWGNLNVQPTGIELVYDEDYLDEKDGHIERSSILYKNELNGIDAIVCYHEKLNPEQVKQREIRLKRYYQSNTPYLLKRRVVNFFYTIRDAIMEVSALFIGRMKSSTSFGSALSGQDKYVSQIQQSIIPPTAYSFEPLLEKYIGKKVVIKAKRADIYDEYLGILKEYTPDFLEILDVNYKKHGDPKMVDMIISRQIGVVRHMGK